MLLNRHLFKLQQRYKIVPGSGGYVHHLSVALNALKWNNL